MLWSPCIESRSLVAAMLKPTKTVQGTEAVEIRHQMLHKAFNVGEAELMCAGMGETHAITLCDHTRGHH